MSVLKVTIKEEHIKLLKHLNWSVKEDVVSSVGHDGDDFIPPFGQNNLYEGIDLVLNGLPENFDPFTADSESMYSDEQKAEWDKLYSELPLVLEVILQKQSFSLGSFKAKYHDRTWRQMK